jgi:hypothetical protein
MLCLLLPASFVQAELISDTASGKKTMSKFMINLAKFVTWPESKFAGEAEPYKYCLMGNDHFGDVLDTAVSEKQAKKRGFSIERLSISDLDAAKSCHVVFLGVASADQATDVIDGLNGLPILTVGEAEQFAQYGGMVGFMGEGREVALAVNKGRLEGAGLKASSRLYRASSR